MALLDEPLPTGVEEGEAILLMRSRLRRRICAAPRDAVGDLGLFFGLSDADASVLCKRLPPGCVDPIAEATDQLSALRGGRPVISLPVDAAHVERCREWLLAQKNSEPAFADIAAFDLPTLLALAQAHDAATVSDRLAFEGAPELPILITGETGTGKELLAEAIHRIWRASDSARAETRLKTLFVSGMPETLVNDELFGHVKGAFTGATTRRLGKLKDADGHTLLIDEVGDLSAEAQVRLLRVLDRGEFSHAGDDATQHVRVRILAATSRDVEREVEDGRFRRDLLHRIGAIHLRLPPLRERAHLKLVVEALLTQRGAKGVEPLVARRAAGALESYTWPGNLRELRHVLDVAIENARGATITLDDLPAKVRRPYLQLALELRAHDIIAERTSTLSLTPHLVAHRVATVADALEAEPGPPATSDYSDALEFLEGIPDQTIEHQSAIERTKRIIATQQECVRLIRLHGIWQQITDKMEEAVTREAACAQVAHVAGKVERALADGQQAADNLRLHDDPWWRFCEHVGSLPLLRGAPPEQIKAALLWAVQALLSLDRRITEGVFDAVRRGEGLRGLFQAAMAALPQEPEDGPTEVGAPPRPRPHQRPKEYWQELSSLPTRAAAASNSGYDAKTIDRYLAEHGITPAWREARPDGMETE